MNWIPVEEQLPESKDWVIAQTQDGTVYPASYDDVKMQWSPLFRGGRIESLMHGRVVFWQQRPTGYPYVTCERMHSYLKTPDTLVCPMCERFGFVKSPASETSAADDEEKATVHRTPRKRTKQGG